MILGSCKLYPKHKPNQKPKRVKNTNEEVRWRFKNSEGKKEEKKKETRKKREKESKISAKDSNKRNARG